MRRNATLAQKTIERTTARRGVRTTLPPLRSVWTTIQRRRTSEPASFPPTPPPNTQSTPPIEYFMRSSPGYQGGTAGRLYTGLPPGGTTTAPRGGSKPLFRWTSSQPPDVWSPWLSRPATSPALTASAPHVAPSGPTTTLAPIFWPTSAPLALGGGHVVHCHVQVPASVYYIQIINSNNNEHILRENGTGLQGTKVH